MHTFPRCTHRWRGGTVCLCGPARHTHSGILFRRVAISGLLPPSSKMWTISGWFISAALYSAVLPLLVWACTSTPAFSSARTTSGLFASLAMNSGVRPKAVAHSRSAPAAASTATTSAWPAAQAQWSGVSPPWSPRTGVRASTSAPASSSSCTTPGDPAAAAMCSGVRPSTVVARQAAGLKPRSSAATSACPSVHATCSGRIPLLMPRFMSAPCAQDSGRGGWRV